VRTNAMAWLSARGLLVALVMLAGGSLYSAPATPPTKAPGNGLVEIGPLARRYGLKATWLRPGQQLRLQGGRIILDFQADSREVAWNGVRLFLGESVVADQHGLSLSATDFRTTLLPLLDSAAARTPGAPKLIVIDAGHGGKDSGTGNRQLKLLEKTFTLDVGRRLKKDLEQRGYRVVLTRANDAFVPLTLRPEMANHAGADLFISLHFNSLPDDAGVSGIETYAFTPAGLRSTAVAERSRDDRLAYPGNRSDHWNFVLGAALHRRLLGELKGVDRGLKRARFVVLKTIQCPSVLVELGFLSNKVEARKISTPVYRERIAEAMADGIGDYAVQLGDAARRHRAQRTSMENGVL